MHNSGVFSSIRRDFVPHISALQWPSDVTIDGEGRLYVADTWNNRIVCFSAKGEFIRDFGKFGKRDCEFQLPSSLCWDFSKNYLIVGDSGWISNKRKRKKRRSRMERD
jgi:hypothetical protein